MESGPILKPLDAGPEDLRRFFRRHAAAVAVVTTNHRGTPVGLLVSSLVSVSVAPPLVSFNVGRSSSSWPALRAAEHVGVHVLDGGQESLAVHFARKAGDRFGPPTSWALGPYAVPVIDRCAAWSVAAVEQRVTAGDHVIVVARLLAIGVRDEAGPLLHHDGRFHRMIPRPVPKVVS